MIYSSGPDEGLPQTGDLKMSKSVCLAENVFARQTRYTWVNTSGPDKWIYSVLTIYYTYIYLQSLPVYFTLHRFYA